MFKFFSLGFKEYNKLMLHVSLIVFCLILATFQHPFYFDDSQIKMDISSARKSRQIQMIISIKAPINTQFTLKTASFDPTHGKHVLKLKQHHIQIEPKVNDEIILMNKKSLQQYRLAFSHPINTEKGQFILHQIQYKGNVKQIILPALNMKLDYLSLDSLYRCHNTLVSIQIDNDRKQIRLHLFTVDRKQSIWVLDEKKWGNSWRQADNQVFYGGAYSKIENHPIQIILISGKYCSIDIKSLTKSHNPLPPKEYYTVQNLISWAPALYLSDEINQQL